MAEASLIATLSNPPTARELSALPQSVKCLEVRADLVGDLNPEWLRNHFRGQLLYTLRSRDEGGADASPIDQRLRRLRAAAHVYDQIDLQGRTDLVPDLLDTIPSAKRLISWQGEAAGVAQLQNRFRELSAVSARLYKLVTRTQSIADELACLSFLNALGRTDTIAYALGPLGFWSRVVALHLGAPAIFGAVGSSTGDSAAPAISRLIDDYHLPEVRTAKELFAIIGDPIFHSLSPRLHNSAYRAHNYPALFVPLRVESFENFWQELVLSRALDALGLPLNGMTVASPHKEAARSKAKTVSGMSLQADSSNILLRNNGWWNADTTDPEVIYFVNQQRRLNLSQKRAAVIGCGGAGRAIAAALSVSGAAVTLINRGAQRGQYAARLLGLPYIPLAEFSAEGYDIVVNATPVGRNDDLAPFPLETLNDEVLVIDLVYGSNPTPLVENSLAREQVVFDGRDVLWTQVSKQFQMMTGNEMPVNGNERSRKA